LEQAKEAARQLLRAKRAQPHDIIKELNQIAANEVERAAIERESRKWPIDLMGGSRRGKVEKQSLAPNAPSKMNSNRAQPGKAMTSARDKDGFPKLPECLDRRREPEPLAEAALEQKKARCDPGFR
jgi:hypothetical protein